MTKVPSTEWGLSRCWAVTARTGSNDGDRSRARTTGASFMASGRVPNTSMIRRAGADWMFALTTVVVLFTLSYTFALFLVSRRKSGSLLPPPDRLFFVFVLPCLNEAVVIERSLERLLSLGGGDFAVLVIDDASTDYTASIVKRFGGDRVWLLRRRLP